MNASTPGPALECIDCGGYSPAARPDDFDDCPRCGSANTTAVTLEPCPAGDTCGDEEHDFGLGLHVTTEN